MRIDVEAPQTDNTDDGVDGGQVRKNRYLFRLSLLITAALLATAFWVSNTQTSAHAATEELALAVPTAPYCPPGSDKPSHSGNDGGGPSGVSPGEGSLGTDGGDTGPLNERDRTAITDYTLTDYRPMNTALRSGDQAAISRHSDTIGTLNNALRKLPDYKGRVYRTARLSREIISSYKPNEIIREKAFLSTSRNPSIDAYGPVRFIIKSETGKNIQKYSEFKKEREVLFMPGTRFLVTAKYQNSEGEWIIEMSEVA